MTLYDLLDSTTNSTPVVVRNQFGHVLASKNAVDLRTKGSPAMLSKNVHLIDVEKDGNGKAYLIIKMFI